MKAQSESDCRSSDVGWEGCLSRRLQLQGKAHSAYGMRRYAAQLLPLPIDKVVQLLERYSILRVCLQHHPQQLLDILSVDVPSKLQKLSQFFVIECPLLKIIEFRAVLEGGLLQVTHPQSKNPTRVQRVNLLSFDDFTGGQSLELLGCQITILPITIVINGQLVEEPITTLMKFLLQNFEPESFGDDNEAVGDCEFGGLTGEVQHDEAELVVERKQVILLEVILGLLPLGYLPFQRILMILDDEPKLLAEGADVLPNTEVLVQLQNIFMQVAQLGFELSLISLWIVDYELDEGILGPGLPIFNDSNLAIDFIAVFSDALILGIYLCFDVLPG